VAFFLQNRAVKFRISDLGFENSDFTSTKLNAKRIFGTQMTQIERILHGFIGTSDLRFGWTRYRTQNTRIKQISTDFE